GRVGPRPEGVGGCDGPVACVLVVVDEDALAALLLPPRRRDELRCAALDLAREREGAATYLAEAPLRLDAARDVDAAVARRLRPSDVPELLQWPLPRRRHLRPLRGARAGLCAGR